MYLSKKSGMMMVDGVEKSGKNDGRKSKKGNTF